MKIIRQLRFENSRRIKFEVRVKPLIVSFTLTLNFIL